MAQPERAPIAAPTTHIKLHHNAAEGYFATPRNPDIDANQTVKLTAEDQSCTICFNPTTTPFGTCQNVALGTPVEIPVGPSDFTVSYCVTNYQSSCTPPNLTENPTGTIKVGSGPVGGR